MGIVPLECRLEPVIDLAKVEPVWRALHERAGASYFLSWVWIGTWLRRLPAEVQPMLLVVSEAGETVGLATVVGRNLRRHGLIRSRALFVNKTGDEALDEITIEYNDILAEPQRRGEVARAALGFLLAAGWDEVFIDAALHGEGFPPASGPGWKMRVRHTFPVFGVDLVSLAKSGKSYLGALSSNTRSQIRRTLRDYEKLGPLGVEVAQSSEDAAAWFADLRELHQNYWIGKGGAGSFSNRFLDGFHRELIETRLAHGDIQLLRVCFGERRIGYLYNFLANGIAHNYQSGFDYKALPGRNRPGVVLHYAAIEFNLAQGSRYYDFMRGDSQTKKTLSTSAARMDDVVAQRRCFRFRFEDAMRDVRDRFFRPRDADVGTSRN